ncbi:CML13, partial [Symbiodinium necroappetens]
VREAADNVSGYPSLDFHDFCSVVDHAVTVEREALQRKIEVWLIRSTALRTDDVAEKMRLFLKSLGVICTKELVVEMMSLGGLSNRRCDTQEELWRLLAAYRACEGFTQE